MLKALSGKDHVNKKLKNVIWYSSDKYMMVFMSFITTVILSRVLTPEILGEIVLLQSVIILFNIVTLLAMDSIFIKKLTEDDLCVFSVLTVKVLASLLSMFLYFMYVLSFDSDIDKVSRLILGLPLVFSFTTVFDLVLMSRKEIYKIASSTLFIYVFVGAAKCFLLYSTDDLLSIAILLVIDQLIVRFYVGMYGFKHRLINFKKYSLVKGNITTTTISLLNEGKYLVLSSFFLVGFVRTNQFFISYYLGNEELAYFSMPVKIVDGLTIIVTTYVASIYPYLLSEIKNNGPRRAATRYFSGITKLSILVAMTVYLFATEIIVILFGEGYMDSVSVLRIYSVAIIFNYIFVASGRWFVALDYTNYVAFRNVLTFIVNIGLSCILIPTYGINGAAISALLAWVTGGYLSLIFVSHSRWLLLGIPKSFLTLNKPL
ncbi:oligosaccharide flippase family protein [Vibrio astriarenae]